MTIHFLDDKHLRQRAAHLLKIALEGCMCAGFLTSDNSLDYSSVHKEGVVRRHRQRFTVLMVEKLQEIMKSL